MLMECPSHTCMGTLHVNTSGHMLPVFKILHSVVVHTIVHVNNSTTESLVFTHILLQ